MTATLDLPGIHRFAASLKTRQQQCDNGEGMVCRNLEERINFSVKLCRETREYINQWAQAIFTGQLAFDQEAEGSLKEAAEYLLQRAKQVAASGRAMNWHCWEFRSLEELHYWVADLDFLLQNWVSPHRAVGPGPRVKLSASAEREITEQIEKMSAR